MSSASNNITIRRMKDSDLPAIIQIHRESFPGSRSTELGIFFLRRMYRWFMRFQPELSLVATDEHYPIGFVAGSIGSYARRLFRYALPQIVLGFVLNPRLVLQTRMFALWRGFAKSLFQTQTPTNPLYTVSAAPDAQASLASIAVGAKGRGRQVSDMLMYAFEQAARELKTDSLFLSVRADNNSARRLYERCGWELVKLDEASNTAAYGKALVTVRRSAAQRSIDKDPDLCGHEFVIRDIKK